MRDQLQEAIDVANLDNILAQRRLAEKQRELEPWKLVVAALAVGAILGGAIIGVSFRPADSVATMSDAERDALVDDILRAVREGQATAPEPGGMHTLP